MWNEIWTEVLYDLLLIGVPFGLAALYMMIRYRAKSPGQVGQAVNLSPAATWGWILIPCALFLADDLLLFGKGWTLWNVQRVVPQNAVEVKVTGHQWYFDFDYGKGVTDSELVVEVGKPVVLRMTSDDVIHSFGLTEYRLKEDLIPGRITYLWFSPGCTERDPGRLHGVLRNRPFANVRRRSGASNGRIRGMARQA